MEGFIIMSIPILYRDSSLVICEKPVGIPSESPGLPDLLHDEIGQNVWPVHRLDQGTGGAVALALSPVVASAMQRLFQDNQVHKEYLAVIIGKLSDQSGTFTDLLWHDRRNNKSFVVKRIRGGVKKAVCNWNTVETTRYGEYDLSLICVRLHTGRTHQIRIQFGSRGYSLVGDRKYGSIIRSDTPALWSSVLSFPHPVQRNRTVSVTSLPPSCFPWNLFAL